MDAQDGNRGLRLLEVVYLSLMHWSLGNVHGLRWKDGVQPVQCIASQTSVASVMPFTPLVVLMRAILHVPELTRIC